MLAVIAAVGSAKNGFMYAHEKAGLTVLGLVGFRIIWGFVGSHHARFANFMVGPAKLLAYVKSRFAGDRSHTAGHAPSGAYATIALLVVLAVMAGLGTMSNDNVLYEGPLAAYVGDFTKDARLWHHRVEKLVFLLIAMHLLAIFIYRQVLKVKLIPAMIKGGEDETAPPISPQRQVFGLVLMAVMLGLSHSLSLLGDRFF